MSRWDTAKPRGVVFPRRFLVGILQSAALLWDLSYNCCARSGDRRDRVTAGRLCISYFPVAVTKQLTQVTKEGRVTLTHGLGRERVVMVETEGSWSH